MQSGRVVNWIIREIPGFYIHFIFHTLYFPSVQTIMFASAQLDCFLPEAVLYQKWKEIMIQRTADAWQNCPCVYAHKSFSGCRLTHTNEEGGEYVTNPFSVCTLFTKTGALIHWAATHYWAVVCLELGHAGSWPGHAHAQLDLCKRRTSYPLPLAKPPIHKDWGPLH